jgi:hypothetical protein
MPVNEDNNVDAMTSWNDFSTAAPDFAEEVRSLFSEHKHHTMATVRRDGAPRISGTEVEFENGELCLGMMPGTRRAADLGRDPRLALHSHSVDPPEQDPGSWCGEAKINGRGVALSSEAGGPDRFRVEIIDVTLTRVGTPADHLLITTWEPSTGVVARRR